METVGGSESLPVTIRPDEISEALKVGVNELSCLFMAFIEE
ncbi:ybbA domain protein [Escherichia coli 3-475-03_S1_C2]|nr:ybbA domain protein [Escherichia coli 3-475-03_S1_C2]